MDQTIDRYDNKMTITANVCHICHPQGITWSRQYDEHVWIDQRGGKGE